HLGEPPPAGRHPAGGLRPARPGPEAGEPAGLPARALHALPGGRRGAARPPRAGWQGAAEDRARGAGAPDPQHRSRLRAVLRRDPRRGLLPARPERLARAGRECRGARPVIVPEELEAIESLWKAGLEEAFSAYQPATAALGEA